MDDRPVVGIFDSGVGGLSVIPEIRKKIPDVIFVYCCDNHNLPYGPRPEDEVLGLVDHAIDRLLTKCRVDVLVVACNTISTVALPRLREKIAAPVIGVVPAIKPAAVQSKSKSIGLLATPGTISRSYTNTLIENFASHCRVVRVGSTRLVSMAEDKLRAIPLDPGDIWREIQALFDSENNEARLDTVVLGCTHFPLLREEFIASAKWPVNWIDSGEAIARRVADVVKNSRQPQPGLTRPDGHIAFFST